MSNFIQTDTDGAGVPTVHLQLQTGSIVPPGVDGPMFLGPPSTAPVLIHATTLPLVTESTLESGTIIPPLSDSGGVMTPVLDANTSAVVPAGVPVSQAVTVAPAAGVASPTNAASNFLGTLESRVADVASNPARHLVLIAVVLFVGWLWFFKRKRR